MGYKRQAMGSWQSGALRAFLPTVTLSNGQAVTLAAAPPPPARSPQKKIAREGLGPYLKLGLCSTTDDCGPVGWLPFSTKLLILGKGCHYAFIMSAFQRKQMFHLNVFCLFSFLSDQLGR
jgi:hypothetical protein